MDANLKVAAITGAYGGLGRELSYLMAEQGYAIVASGRDEVSLAKLIQELKSKTRAEGILADVRKSSECERFIAAAQEKFGRLDVLINNAAVLKMEPIEDMGEDNLKDIFETNVFGAVFCSKAAARIMKKQKSGCIVNIASRAAVDRYPQMLYAYTASKAALIGFSGCLRNELADSGIDVFVVSPYVIRDTLLYRSVEDRTKAEAKQKIVASAVMTAKSVAQKILERIEGPGGEWHIILGGNLN